MRRLLPTTAMARACPRCPRTTMMAEATCSGRRAVSGMLSARANAVPTLYPRRGWVLGLFGLRARHRARYLQLADRDVEVADQARVVAGGRLLVEHGPQRVAPLTIIGEDGGHVMKLVGG